MKTSKRYFILIIKSEFSVFTIFEENVKEVLPEGERREWTKSQGKWRDWSLLKRWAQVGDEEDKGLQR